jgi:CheY-like chemotaxis protein
VEQLCGVRVLYVDDNAMHRTLVQRQLLAWGMQVDCVADAPAALEQLRMAQRDGCPYALALLDYQMPEMDGLELAQAIKADPALAAVRLVLLSSAAQRGQGHEIQQAGIAASLTKPIRQVQLSACLTTVLGATPVSAPLGPRLPQAVALAQGRVRVLVAEDNVVNQKVVVRMLEKLGCRVDVVADGHEAVAALDPIAYDLVFMDCQMPELDGFAATAAIRAREAQIGGHVPIIAMTANTMQGDRERCLAAGMDDYVSKPAKAEDLTAILRRWI